MAFSFMIFSSIMIDNDIDAGNRLMTAILYISLTSSAVIVSAWLMFFGWRRRHTASGLAFAMFALTMLVWSAFYTLELASSGDTALSNAFSKLSYIGILTAPPTWLIFVGLHTDSIHWLSAAHPQFKRNTALLFAMPVVSLALVMTNEWHHLHWHQINTIIINDFEVYRAEYGPAFWASAIYAYGLMAYALTALLRVAATTIRPQQRQAFWIVFGSLIPWAGNLLSVTNVSPLPGLDLTPISFVASGAIVGWVLVRYEGLRLPLIARDSVMDSMTDGIIIIDQAGRVMEFNQTAIELLSMDAATATGKPLRSVFADHPELMEAYHYIVDPLSTNPQREVRVRRPGSRIDYLFLRISPVRSTNGLPVARLLQLRDISLHKKAQNIASRRMTELTILRDIDTRISSMLNMDDVLHHALVFAMKMSDADAGFISLIEGDQQRIVQAMGRYTGDLVGQFFAFNIGITGYVIRTGKPHMVTDTSAEPKYYAELPDTRSQITYPLIAHDRMIGVLNLESLALDNFTREAFDFVRLLAARIASAIENADLFTTTQNQLAELRDLYVQVSDLERFRSDMLRLASHDLRSPLGNVQGYLELLRMDGHLLNTEQQDILYGIERQTERMNAIINDILSIERAQGGRHTGNVDLVALAQDIVGVHQPQAENKALTLTFETDLPEIVTHGDKAQLGEVIANLITNAIKYTPEGGTIQVSLQMTDRSLVLDVVDNGYGIPADQQDKLFKPFSRINQHETVNIDGTGLGLHLVKSIIERHGGAIRFESAHGEGSRFGFELPLMIV
ncbi:MAG: PAS domain S-box protein [Anaerolineaceae bacterium]|nr:MAG: PAS domain S-box protein [Anaerolineaceae bacterium]